MEEVWHSGRHAFTLVPILVGALSPESEAAYGALLAKYLTDPATLFSVSSDFCHWGSRSPKPQPALHWNPAARMGM